MGAHDANPHVKLAAAEQKKVASAGVVKPVAMSVAGCLATLAVKVAVILGAPAATQARHCVRAGGTAALAASVVVSLAPAAVAAEGMVVLSAVMVPQTL